MAKAASVCAAFGYDEININCGCPSPRVKEGSFGAVLMLEPLTVARIAERMRESAGGVPVTVKCRLGVDDHDSYEELNNFINVVAKSGVNHFIIHARKAYLQGLNPKENRTVPPLKYDWVYRLAEDFPSLQFSLNGGLQSIEQMKEAVAEDRKLAGCMIGRVAYNDPWMMGRIDREMFGEKGCELSRREVLLKYAEAVEQKDGVCNSVVVKPIMNLFTGEKDSNKYRRFLGTKVREEKYKGDAKLLIEDAVEVFTQCNPTAANKVHD
eukprot:TRINITY_DN10102_c0_g1_i12.p1 TRINITY_DN10102_c0_g1~~TRINITY_DN10102_c0_g1_i12.p1  ORF type:complete len:267 (+),score=77.51 TRINITY_DN10102_c0_g1_i12:349-1149(+)